LRAGKENCAYPETPLPFYLQKEARQSEIDRQYLYDIGWCGHAALPATLWLGRIIENRYSRQRRKYRHQGEIKSSIIVASIEGGGSFVGREGMLAKAAGGDSAGA